MTHMLGPLHVAAASLALILGIVQLARRKGTRAHRALGWVYVAVMVALNVTALGVYHETGTWNLFHTLALASLATVVVGITGVVLSRPRWWPPHAYWMTGSYLGVILAGAFQLATHVPMRTAALWIATLSGLGLGAWLFLAWLPGEIARTEQWRMPRT